MDTAVDDVKLQFLEDGSVNAYHSSYVYTNKYEIFLEDM